MLLTYVPAAKKSAASRGNLAMSAETPVGSASGFFRKFELNQNDLFGKFE
jgi:hypothetical protein